MFVIVKIKINLNLKETPNTSKSRRDNAKFHYYGRFRQGDNSIARFY